MYDPLALGALSGTVTVHGPYRLRHVVQLPSVPAEPLGDTTMRMGSDDRPLAASVRWRIEILDGDIATLQLSALEQFALRDATELSPDAGIRAARVMGGLNGRVAHLEITRWAGSEG